MRLLAIVVILSTAGCAAVPTRPAAVHAATPVPSTDPFVAAYRVLRPSVVLLTMKVPSDDPRDRTHVDDAYGSGAIIASDRRESTILTVQHVIDGARDLHVTLDDARRVPARVIASDVRRDLALVKIPVGRRRAIRFARARDIEPGVAVGIAGYPIPDAFADEHLHVRTSVYAGRISSIRDDSIELDLPVIPGESGGPVFLAADGRVVALGESRFDEERAIGFGVPLVAIEHFLARVYTRRHVSPPIRLSVPRTEVKKARS